MATAVRIEKGPGGWGGPLTIAPQGKRQKILVIAGGAIPEIAHRIGELTGAQVVDGFRTSVPAEETLCAIIDCGGTMRCGLYPKQGIPTINIHAGGPSGPLAKHIVPELYVSGVTPANIAAAGTAPAAAAPASQQAKPAPAAGQSGGNAAVKRNFVERIGQGVGTVISTFYQAGRDAVQLTIQNILPFMAFIAALTGIILYSGLGNWVAGLVAPLASSPIGLVALTLVLTVPVLSPFLGPGSVIAQVLSALLGTQIATGAIPPQFALPALFGINAQVGADFIPVGLSMMEAEPETVEIGVPAVLFSRMITGPIAVIIAYLFSLGMY